MTDMYAGIDIGGTKTLVASLDDDGTITQKIRFEACQDYDDQLEAMARAFTELKQKNFVSGAAGVPVTVFDRAHGRAMSFGNLPWRKVPIVADLERLAECPMIVENDAKLAGLSEAMLHKNKSRVLYVTVSTGIGYSLTVDGRIDTNIGDGGGRTLLLEHKGKRMPWEDFASGRAIVARYGKKAQDITDIATWRRIAYDLSIGFIELIAIMQPNIIVIGGSVGSYFERYGELLSGELRKLETPMLTIPPIVPARRPEEAVLFGCYEIAKEAFRARTH